MYLKITQGCWCILSLNSTTKTINIISLAWFVQSHKIVHAANGMCLVFSGYRLSFLRNLRESLISYLQMVVNLNVFLIVRLVHLLTYLYVNKLANLYANMLNYTEKISVYIYIYNQTINIISYNIWMKIS